MNQISIWETLSHDSIIENVEKCLDKKLSNLVIRRNSYINRVYELEEYDSRDRFIVKFYRPSRWNRELILEEHNLLKDLSKNEISIIPPLEYKQETLFSFNNIPFTVFPKKGGRAIDEFNQESWQEIGRTLARIHLITEKIKDSKRVVWRPGKASAYHLEVLKNSDFVLPEFKDSLIKVIELFINKYDADFQNQEYILIHGDCHKGNLLHRPNEGIYVVDFDDICVGSPIQDVWMLFPGEIETYEKELSWFLKGYETFRPFNMESLKIVKALRGMRIIHFTAWLATQYDDLDFSAHFPEVGTKKYWNQLIKDLQEIIYSPDC